MPFIKNNILADRGIKWLFLVLLTAVCILIFHYTNIPAPHLLGAMISGIITAVLYKNSLKVAFPVFQSAQSILGCMIAQTFTAAVIADILGNWFIICICVFLMLLCSFFIGYFLSIKKVLPGTTAVWGCWPGGAMTMVILSEAYGADARLVAFMQYMRVVIVAFTASIVTKLWGFDIPKQAYSLSQTLFAHGVEPGLFMFTLIFAALCVLIARRLHMPAGALLLAMFLGAVAINAGIMQIVLPKWLLTTAYIIIGWSIGLRFTRDTIKYAFKAFPKVLISIFVLIVVCAAVSWFLVFYSAANPLTAYLAVSPGGSDSIAIIAASIDGLDIPLIMSVQVMRFVIILLIGPYSAKRLTLYLNKKYSADKVGEKKS